jgi:NaMN:DMB phosphoribosyltransferase
VTEARAAEAARDALALVIAVCESDQVAADTLIAAYSDRPRALLDGFVQVVRTLALQRITDSGGTFSEDAISAELRSLLQGAFADHG